MIASLTGRVVRHDGKSLVLDVHGVGFLLHVLPRTQSMFPSGTEATIITHLQVREDALELFGFADAREHRLFTQLLSVSGVGPKMAMGVMTAAPVADLEAAIDRGEATLLTHVSGVGTKTAQRIIIDLRGKLQEDFDADTTHRTMVDTLLTLGYSAREARDAVAGAPPTGTIEERIKAVLRQMGKS